MRLGEAEEFYCRKVERDIGSTLIHIQLDHIISLCTPREPGARVRYVNPKPWGICRDVKEAYSCFNYCFIYLHRIYLHVGSSFANGRDGGSCSHSKHERIVGVNE